jgi:hypothetical protein
MCNRANRKKRISKVAQGNKLSKSRVEAHSRLPLPIERILKEFALEKWIAKKLIRFWTKLKLQRPLITKQLDIEIVSVIILSV